jgi:hypothetical protein
MRLLLPRWVILGVALAGGPARAVTIYDAAQGTMPEAQGWTLTESLDPVVAYVKSVGASGLHLSTTGLQSDGAHGGGVWWTYDVPTLDFSQDFAVEIRVRLVSAPDHAVSGNGWPRPGWAITLTDVTGRSLFAGLGSSEICLSNSFFGPYGSPSIVFAPFNTTDAQHVYRIERAGGPNAVLRVDGVVKLQLPALGPMEVAAGDPILYFGDQTYWANSESYTTWVKLVSPTVDASGPSDAQLLSTRVLRSPTQRVRMSYRTGAAGTLACDVYDVAGRKVAGHRREVEDGEAGVFEPASTLRNGLYFYRARLIAPGAEVRAASLGRFVVLN